MYEDFTLCALRSAIHRFLHLNKISTFGQVWRDGVIPTVEPRSVRRLLRDIGFKGGKRDRNFLLIEQEDIVTWQTRHL